MAIYANLVNEKEADVESAGTESSLVKDMIHQAFVRKVYTILAVQMMISAAVVISVECSSTMQNFVFMNPEFFTLLVGIAVAALFITMCCSELLRRHPFNLIILSIFNVCISIIIGYSSIFYNLEFILLAALITVLVVCSITVSVFKTTIRLSILGGILRVAITLLFVCIIMVLVRPAKTFQLLIACGAALLFSFYLINDTQMVLGACGDNGFNPEDYVSVIFSLFLDIINLFIYVLATLGLSDMDI